MANEQLPSPDQLSYEQARDELVRIVKSLEGGQAPLEETLSMWERGEALAARCHAILSAAEARIQNARGEGTPANAPAQN
ncbi:MAG: exodeoxyribonuclease VII small subunit [Actinomycetaceae bacterium]|nr:exodeoxyribonuclease VII small subunit [Actinomycetaceae bacterium]